MIATVTVFSNLFNHHLQEVFDTTEYGKEVKTFFLLVLMPQNVERKFKTSSASARGTNKPLAYTARTVLPLNLALGIGQLE